MIISSKNFTRNQSWNKSWLAHLWEIKLIKNFPIKFPICLPLQLFVSLQRCELSLCIPAIILCAQAHNGVIPISHCIYGTMHSLNICQILRERVLIFNLQTNAHNSTMPVVSIFLWRILDQLCCWLMVMNLHLIIYWRRIQSSFISSAHSWAAADVAPDTIASICVSVDAGAGGSTSFSKGISLSWFKGTYFLQLQLWNLGSQNYCIYKLQSCYESNDWKFVHTHLW